MVPISAQTLTILESEEQILHQGTTKLEQDYIRQHGTMARVEVGRVLASVDVGGYNSVEITPANDDTKSYTSFVHT